MNEQTLCPLQVEILMHYYLSPLPFQKPDCGYLEQFLQEGVLSEETSPYSLTDKGCAWVEAILSTPCPAPAWITADGRVITLGGEQ